MLEIPVSPVPVVPMLNVLFQETELFAHVEQILLGTLIPTVKLIRAKMDLAELMQNVKIQVPGQFVNVPLVSTVTPL